MAKLETVEGIGDKYANKLRLAGVGSTNALLEKGSTPKGRKEIAKKSGITEKLILEWVNHVDLFRVKGVGGEYADLLEEAGVDTVPELARRKAVNLREAMAKTNEKKKLVRQLPGVAAIDDWIQQAKKLKKIVKY